MQRRALATALTCVLACSKSSAPPPNGATSAEAASAAGPDPAGTTPSAPASTDAGPAPLACWRALLVASDGFRALSGAYATVRLSIACLGMDGTNLRLELSQVGYQTVRHAFATGVPAGDGFDVTFASYPLDDLHYDEKLAVGATLFHVKVDGGKPSRVRFSEAQAWRMVMPDADLPLTLETSWAGTFEAKDCATRDAEAQGCDRWTVQVAPGAAALRVHVERDGAVTRRYDAVGIETGDHAALDCRFLAFTTGDVPPDAGAGGTRGEHVFTLLAQGGKPSQLLASGPSSLAGRRGEATSLSLQKKP